MKLYLIFTLVLFAATWASVLPSDMDDSKFSLDGRKSRIREFLWKKNYLGASLFQSISSSSSHRRLAETKEKIQHEVAFAADKIYPYFVRISVISEVSGRVFCNHFSSDDTDVPTIKDLKELGVRYWVGKMGSLIVKPLKAETSYNIYCYFEDIDGNPMVRSVADSLIKVTTPARYTLPMKILEVTETSIKIKTEFHAAYQVYCSIYENKKLKEKLKSGTSYDYIFTFNRLNGNTNYNIRCEAIDYDHVLHASSDSSLIIHTKIPKKTMLLFVYLIIFVFFISLFLYNSCCKKSMTNGDNTVSELEESETLINRPNQSGIIVVKG